MPDTRTMIPISADAQTREKFGLSESVAIDEVPKVINKIMPDKGYSIKFENNVLEIKRFLRD